MLTTLVAVLSLATSEIGTLKDGVIHVNASEAAELLEERDDIQVLDVRTRREFNAERIEGAAQINYYAPNFKSQVIKLPRDVPYLVHCRSGNRSGRAVRILKDAGIDEIYHLDGGILGWKAVSLPVVTGAPSNE